MTDEPAIQARDLTRTFGRFTAVDHISFDVANGEVFGFLGANGAGKTTAIRMLIGLLAPTSGTARVAGRDVATEADQVKRGIGYMSQRFSLYEDLTVRENMVLYGGIYGLTDREIRERTGATLERLGFSHAAGTLVGEIPLGWKQKLAFSVALLHRPRDRLSRRADRRRGPHHPPAVLGDDLRDGGRRNGGARDHALHGRGRILRSPLHHGGRPHRRPRHAGRGAGGVRRRQHRRGLPAPRATGAGRDSGNGGGAAMTAFGGFVRKEVHHIVRDRRTLVILLLMPLLQVLLFGYAIRTEVRDIRLAVVDPRPDVATLALRNRFAGSGLYRVEAVVRGTPALDPLFASGRVRQAVVFRPGFAEALGRGEGAPVQVITDASDPNSGAAMRAYAVAIVQEYEREQRARGAGVRIVPQVRMRFNPTMDSAFLFVPGLIAFVLIIISALMTAISLTREKETGTMEVLLASPLRPVQIIAGKVLPYLVLAFLNVLTTLAVARVVFSVPVRGSVLLLLAESTLYSLTALALGVLISTRTSSQRVAMTAALAGLMMPTLMLSGFIFPLESMPRALQVVSNVIPARWFVVIARGIMLKGVGLTYLWKETLVLAGMTALLLGVAVRSFRIRLG